MFRRMLTDSTTTRNAFSGLADVMHNQPWLFWPFIVVFIAFGVWWAVGFFRGKPPFLKP